MISDIQSIFQEEGYVYVTAIVEDVKLIYHATWYDPPEYGPGLCESSFPIEEDEELPENESELIAYLDSMDLDWVLLPDDGY